MPALPHLLLVASRVILITTVCRAWQKLPRLRNPCKLVLIFGACVACPMVSNARLVARLLACRPTAATVPDPAPARTASYQAPPGRRRRCLRSLFENCMNRGFHGARPRREHAELHHATARMVRFSMFHARAAMEPNTGILSESAHTHTKGRSCAVRTLSGGGGCR